MRLIIGSRDRHYYKSLKAMVPKNEIKNFKFINHISSQIKLKNKIDSSDIFVMLYPRFQPRVIWEQWQEVYQLYAVTSKLHL